MRKQPAEPPLPRNVARNIVRRAAQAAADGETALVLTVRQGKPSRVFGLKEYLKIKESALAATPHKRRKELQDIPDPLGAVDLGTLLLPITRENMYDE